MPPDSTELMAAWSVAFTSNNPFVDRMILKCHDGSPPPTVALLALRLRNVLPVRVERLLGARFS